MIDFGPFSFNTAIKAAWVKMFCSPSDADRKTIPQYFLNKFGSNLNFKCNYDYKLLELDDFPQFYRAVVSSWQEVRDSFSADIDITEEIIWNNKVILVNSKPVSFSVLVQCWCNRNK